MENDDLYENIQALYNDIANYLINLPVSVHEYRLDELLKKWAKRHQKALNILGILFFIGALFWSFLLWKQENQYQNAIGKAREQRKKAQTITVQGRNGREEKLKLLLESLTEINQALKYKPEKFESENYKIEIVEEMLPFCYEEEDYQLASFLVKDLRTLVHFQDKTRTFSTQVEEKKLELLKQHLSELDAWEKKYKSNPIEEQVQQGEREDFIFEVSKMKEEEVLNKLLKWVNEGKVIFTTDTTVSSMEKLFYQDIVKALGRSGNKKAGEQLRICLQDLWHYLRILQIEGNMQYLSELREGKVPESIQKILKEFLLIKGENFEKQYYLKKVTTNQWEYINEQQKNFFTIKFSQTRQMITFYDTKKKDNKEYFQWMQDLIISLCYLEDHASIHLIFEIQYDSELSSFSSQIEYVLKKLLQHLVLDSPKTAFDYFQQGVINSYRKKFDEAISDYTEAIRLNPQLSEVYSNRGVAKQKKKDLEGAIADYTEAIRLNPQSADAYINRGNAKNEKQDLDSAVTDFTEAIRLNPQHSGAYINRGVVKQKKKDLEGAIADYTEAIRFNPQYSEAYISRGKAKNEKKELEGAIADYTEAIRLNPQSAEAYINRGISRKDKNNLEDAIADFTETIRLNPQFVSAYVNRAGIKDTKKDFDGAISDYTEAIRFNPQLPEVYNNRGATKQKKQDLEGAIADFNEELRLNPQYALAYFNRGIVKQCKQDLEGAITDFNEALRLNPQLTEVYNNRGLVKKEKNNLEGAIADFTEIIRLNSQHSEAYYNRGVTKCIKKDLEGASEDFTEAIHLNPQYSEAYYNRGITKCFKKDLEGASEDFTEAIHLNPQYSEAYYNRGNIKYINKQDLEGAIADLTEAIRFNPKYALAYASRAGIKDAKKDLEGAIADYNEAIRFNPQLPEVYNNRGAVKQKKQDLEGAIVDFNEELRLNPQFALAYFNRGIVKKLKQDFEGSIEDWEKALSLENNGQIQQLLIETLRQYSREQFRKKEWNGAKTNLLKLKKYLPLNDPQQKQLEQKIQQLEKLLLSEEKK
ncbi:MAG: tetratricopeptide repeat protein [Planctomycetota bacterium]